MALFLYASQIASVKISFDIMHFVNSFVLTKYAVDICIESVDIYYSLDVL